MIHKGLKRVQLNLPLNNCSCFFTKPSNFLRLLSYSSFIFLTSLSVSGEQVKDFKKTTYCVKSSATLLTLYVIKDSSFWFDTVNSRWSIVYIECSQVNHYNFQIKLYFSEDCFYLANSVQSC